MSAKQCTKCIHDEMCKYKDEIEKIKEQHVFIDDITCNRFTNPTSISSEQKQPKRTTIKLKKHESKPETTTEVETKSEPILESEQNDDYDDDDMTDFDSLRVSNLFLSESTVKILTKNNINTVSDIYTLNNSPDFKWSSVKGLKENQYNEINNKMTAFNKPKLVDYN